MSEFCRLPRPHLLRRLQRALRLGHVFVSAPPGYGKTTLLQMLVASQPGTGYLSLSSEDTDLAWLRARVQPLLHADMTVVLDDLHYLADAEEAITWLAQAARTPSVHWVLAGRQIPPTLAALRLQAEFLHITAADLAFTPEETKALLMANRPLPNDSIGSWYRQTEGWPLALALVAQQHSELAAAPALHQDALFQRLAQTLLRQLPMPALRFMQLTAIPLRFSDELAAALLSIPQSKAGVLRQEIMRRNLFVEATDVAGWWRYHDLIRAFLITSLQQAGEDVAAHYHCVVTWFAAKGDLPPAIEHALAGALYEDAAQLISRIAPTFIAETGRYHTFRRWILGLPEAVQAQHPLLLMQLGRALREVGGRKQGWQQIHRALSYAESGAARDTLVRVQLGVAETHLVDGDANAALAICQAVLQERDLKPSLRRRALKVAGGAHYFRSELHKTRRMLEAALALPEDAESPPDAHIRQNLIVTTLVPLGDFATAHRYLRQNDRWFADRLVEQIWHLLTWGWYAEAIGDWETLAAMLAEIRRLEAQTEQADESNTGEMVLRALLHIGRGEFADAAQVIEAVAAYPEIIEEQLLYVALCRAWLARRQGDYPRTIALVDEALAQPWDVPLYRAELALERMIACEFLTSPPSTPVEEGANQAAETALRILLRLRARPCLVRLRALQALRYHRQDDGRWQRAARTVLAAAQRPGYFSLLTRRDPELGARFWALCLAEGIGVEEGSAALQQIGQIEPITVLLADARPIVRGRAAATLAALQREEAIPFLVAALDQEKEKDVVAALETALAQVESAPAPLLTITLLGDFAVQRGDQPITPADWQRPAVRRLFQYFALHRAQPLTREQILEDLWPDTEPEKARASFRTVFSWLRKVLEPYFRPKSPSRYFRVEGDIYTFDPQHNSLLAQIDAEAFVATVTPILRTAEDYVLPPLPDALLAALTSWQPLLPDALYESWTLDARERLQELYIRGCLYAAQALLARGRPAEAAPWAANAIAVAPWLEEAYQALMRAHARQGQRSLAIKTYDNAVAALERELDVPPSTLTEWLMQRLRADEEI